MRARRTGHRRFEFEESPWKWSLQEVAHSRRAALTPNSQRPLPGGHPGVQAAGARVISRARAKSVCGRWPRPHIITPIDRARLRECPPTPVTSADGVRADDARSTVSLRSGARRAECVSSTKIVDMAKSETESPHAPAVRGAARARSQQRRESGATLLAAGRVVTSLWVPTHRTGFWFRRTP